MNTGSYLGENYENVIVLVNSTNAMALGALETIPGVDAALMVGGTGDNGAKAIPEILFGDVNPSGHLTDTYAYDFKTASTYANIGKDGTGAYTNGEGLYPYDGTTNGNLGESGGWAYPQVSYVDYVEGIYVGYKWYETADAEGYWNNISNEYGKGYDGVVQYPFGYGLSYTDFDWEITNSTSGALSKDGTVDVTVKVTNTGSTAGKDVVQLYYAAPYYAGEIEKSAKVLGDYAKTSLLQPGESEEGSLTLDVYDMASYDSYDSNHNGFIGFELDQGSYTFYVSRNAHEFGLVNGAQARQLGINGLYAPAANMHRTPFGARNYEYYSEDSYLSGMCATLSVRGCLEAGTFVYVKHFICDDADAYIYRDSVYTWMTEQTLREIYLSPFKMMVQEGGCTGLMSSYNRIGAVWAGGSQALLINLLRDEWGFQGTVLTDYADHHAYMNGDHMIRMGGDLWMDGWLSDGTYEYETTSNSMQQAQRQASKNIIYMTLNAEVCRADYAANGGNSLYITEQNEGLNQWLTALTAFDVVIVAIKAVYFTLRIRKSKKN